MYVGFFMMFKCSFELCKIIQFNAILKCGFKNEYHKKAKLRAQTMFLILTHTLRMKKWEKNSASTATALGLVLKKKCIIVYISV